MNEETGYKLTKTDGCALIGAIIFAGIGFLISNFIGSVMPDTSSGYGPPPIFVIFMTVMPIVMFSLPLLFCIFMMTRQKRLLTQPVVHRYHDETMVYTGDYQLQNESTSEKSEGFYLIPRNCPTCNNPLSMKEIEWIGPLEAKCPHCHATIEAKVRE